MNLKLERLASNGDATIGALWLDGGMECFTLEDEPRAEKVAGETRIPAGAYRVGVREEGGMIQRYKRRFAWQRGMLWLRMVPGFQYVYIHVGNTDEDTAGCILVGAGANLKTMTLTDSVRAYKRLYEKIVAAAEAGDLTIEIVDRDTYS